MDTDGTCKTLVVPSRKRRRIEKEDAEIDDNDVCEDVHAPEPFSGGCHSPTMVGKTVDMFRGKDVLYLLTFRNYDDKFYIKFGRTQDVERRMRTHLLVYSDAQIWCIHECVCSMFELENRFKTRMRYMGHLVELTIQGKRKLEILQGISPEDAEQILLGMKDELESTDERKLTMQTLAYKSSVLRCLMNMLAAPVSISELKSILETIFK